MVSKKNYILQELRQSITWSFFLCMLGTAGCIFLDNFNAIPYLWQNNGMSVAYYFWNSLQGPGAYGPYLIPLLCSIPYAMSYNKDCEANIVLWVVEKTGIRAYCAGKMLTAFLTGFFVCVGGMWLSVLLMLRYVPFATTDILVEFLGFPFYKFLAGGNGSAYFVILIGLMGVWCGLWVDIALCLSSFLKSAYISLASVVVFQFGGVILLSTLHIPVALRPDSWFSGTASWCNDSGTFICCIALVIIVETFLGSLFTWKVRKNLYG